MKFYFLLAITVLGLSSCRNFVIPIVQDTPATEATEISANV